MRFELMTPSAGGYSALEPLFGGQFCDHQVSSWVCWPTPVPFMSSSTPVLKQLAADFKQAVDEYNARHSEHFPDLSNLLNALLRHPSIEGSLNRAALRLKLGGQNLNDPSLSKTLMAHVNKQVPLTVKQMQDFATKGLYLSLDVMAQLSSDGHPYLRIKWQRIDRPRFADTEAGEASVIFYPTDELFVFKRFALFVAAPMTPHRLKTHPEELHEAEFEEYREGLRQYYGAQYFLACLEKRQVEFPVAVLRMLLSKPELLSEVGQGLFPALLEENLKMGERAAYLQKLADEAGKYQKVDIRQNHLLATSILGRMSLFWRSREAHSHPMLTIFTGNGHYEVCVQRGWFGGEPVYSLLHNGKVVASSDLTQRERETSEHRVEL